MAWNFYEDIKKNNTNLSDNFINIKELETNSQKLGFSKFQTYFLHFQKSNQYKTL